MTAVNTATTHGFLFADLRDYTQFVETRGDDAAAALLGRYRALIREVIGKFDGAEIRTEGDGLYVVFPSASSAVLGGLAILAAAAEATRTDPAQPLKIGIECTPARPPKPARVPSDRRSISPRASAPTHAPVSCSSRTRSAR